MEEAKLHLSIYEGEKNATPPREAPLLAEVQSRNAGILPLLARARTAAAEGRVEEALELHLEGA
jgi:hypothetical protein